MVWKLEIPPGKIFSTGHVMLQKMFSYVKISISVIIICRNFVDSMETVWRVILVMEILW